MNVRQSKQLTGKHGLREPVDGKPATICTIRLLKVLPVLHYCLCIVVPDKVSGDI